MLGQVLAANEYLRQRVAPSLRDPDYLSLTDLRRAVEEFSRAARGRLFDFGCGGAPYRPLFTGCTEYVRADVTPGPEIDRVLPAGGGTGEPDAAYDVALSTQVLEHVAAPDEYVRECFRILRPGGQLFLTTHGMFQEHGCPHDYQRWTARGLEEAVTRAGFRVVKSYKLNTEMRGAIQLWHHSVEHFRCSGRTVWQLLFGVARRLHRRLGIPLWNWLGSRFPEQGLVPGDNPASVYTGVAVWARKP